MERESAHSGGWDGGGPVKGAREVSEDFDAGLHDQVSAPPLHEV
ncbi:MAG: hypothetical protein AB7O76_10635 [Rhizobiaceae bacterium]